MDKKIRVLFVCLGNICRSPLAEGIFRYKIKKKGLSGHFEVDSCGTSNYHIGDQPDHRTSENALNHGIRLSHQARQLFFEDLKKFDYLLAMDRDNLRNIKKLDKEGDYGNKIFLLRSFAKINNGEDVPDPYHGGEEGFENVYNIIDQSVDALLNYLTEKKQN